MGWILLVAGVALWWGAHFFNRLAPDRRAAMGDRGRGIVALALFVSVGLMILGYMNAWGPVWWGRSPALVGINNLLVLAGFYLYAASGMKTRATRVIRHPQLTGFSLWAVAHLLVNGDLASFMLFGGLLVWAQAEIVVLNRAQPEWTPPPPAPAGKEIGAIVGAIVVTAVVMLIHNWLGYRPWA
ncbi:hypothetical protein HKCCE2091_13840 [Rhodobacterales bacterium HKCCE2091]|nr:hypothetical protein [Rhodobacterales bacterium HKCCE2091]